ncbi:hypothetical protein CXIVA_16210 [Clostridium sp. SY8519]|nr:hypothetical protein CXIVA_16210 [Clostridium sp. SY8519]
MHTNANRKAFPMHTNSHYNKENKRNKEAAYGAWIKVFFKTLFTNKYALLLLIYILLQQIAGGTITAGGTYYFQHVYGDINGFSQMMAVTVVAAVIALLVCPFLVKKIGSKKMFSLGCILTVICYIIMIISGRHTLITLLICLPLSQVFGQMFLMTQAGPIAAAVSDYSFKNTGVHVEGITSSVVNIDIKVGTAIATGVLGLIMSIGGYAEGAAEQSVRAVNSIYFAYMIVPLIIFAVLGILFMTTYKLETPTEIA